MAKLHVFDMDGTLLRGASVEEISRLLGRHDEAQAFEQSYLRGEVDDADGPRWWAGVFELWASATDDELDAAFEACPWMEGIEDVFHDIAARGEHSVVISQSPQFIAHRLKRWGVEAAYGSRVAPGVLGTVDDLLTSQDKVVITERLLGEFGLSHTDCVAYGDSTSDFDLFAILTRTVAIRPDERIRSMATAVYDGIDLREAYQLGRRLLDGLSTEPAPIPAP